MASCTHRYRDQERACPHEAVGESGLCLWHNQAVRKGDPYVRDLLAQADMQAKGDLAEFQLAGLAWPGASLPLRNLRCADLRDTVLDGAALDGSDLTGSVLRRASLRRCDLRGARLAGTDLSGANLCDADLRDADLSGAVIDGTLLMGADLTGADLNGAEVKSFRWNRRTRFAGVKGFEPQGEAGGDAPTQAFLAPLAAETRGVAVSDLASADPDDDRTREYSALPVDTTPVAPLPPVLAETRIMVQPAPSHRWWPLAAAASLAAAGLAIGTWGWLARGAVNPDASRWTALERERDNLLRQHDADLAEMRRIQERERAIETKLGTHGQELAQRRAEVEVARSALREAQLDAGRRQNAEDRAALLGITVRELESINGELARHGARQEHLGRVLADGVVRLDRERGEAVLALDRNRTDAQRLVHLEEEVRRLGGQVREASQERDALAERNRRLAADLQVAQQGIDRFLARIEGTHLREALAGRSGDAPLLSVEAGSPIALNGDYLLTLRVDPGPQVGSVQMQVVVQRPAAAANPEVTVMLFDADQRPLRRLSFAFPHVDRGSPLVSSTTITACDRFPAFARVQVVPGLDGMTAAR